MMSIIIVILILGILVLVHELGHFISAIKLGVEVEEFGIGFPPKLFSVKRKGVIYSLNLIPLGGFVKITGESGDDSDDPNSFANQAAWKKIIILSAGVFMNFIFAIIFLSAAFYFGIPQAIDNSIPADKVDYKNIMIVEVLKDSPADQAGITVGDEVVLLNDKIFDSSDGIYDELGNNQGAPISLTINRGNEKLSFNLESRVMTEGDPAIIGVGLVDTGVIHYGFFASIWQGISTTILMIWRVIEALFNLFAQLFTEGKLAPEIGGPVAVVVIAGQMANLGLIYILQFAAILSINLGVINFFPFPALDGGRVMFVIAELITRKKLSEKVETIIHNSGFILILVLLAALTFRDFSRYGGAIWNGVKNLF